MSGGLRMAIFTGAGVAIVTPFNEDENRQLTYVTIQKNIIRLRPVKLLLDKRHFPHKHGQHQTVLRPLMAVIGRMQR